MTTPANTTLHVTLPADLKARLERLALDSATTPAELATEAIRLYVEVQEGHAEELRAGVREATAGELASPEEVRAVLTKWARSDAEGAPAEDPKVVLLDMPDVGEDADFERLRDVPPERDLPGSSAGPPAVSPGTAPGGRDRLCPMLNPTPREKMVDAQGRPYFLWDADLTLEEFEKRLADPDSRVRAYFVGKLMRQAKPDDVFEFVSAATIRSLWPEVQPYLGNRREFWSWLFDEWGKRGLA